MIATTNIDSPTTAALSAARNRREQAITALAGRQHGVITRAQLVRIGLGGDAIDKRLRAGRLHRLHRGVYLLGHAVAPPYALELAAVLACGRLHC